MYHITFRGIGCEQNGVLKNLFGVSFITEITEHNRLNSDIINNEIKEHRRVLNKFDIHNLFITSKNTKLIASSVDTKVMPSFTIFAVDINKFVPKNIVNKFIEFMKQYAVVIFKKGVKDA